jgi:GT2 family glycosyltransferase
MSRPFVSILMPTYNRRRFFESALICYKHQTYPKDRMEWIIYDDGTDCIRDIVEEAAKTIPNIRYFYQPDKLLIGAKRNKCMDVAKGEIHIWMDDDDYYPPERVAHVVTKMSSRPHVQLAGSSEIYMYYTDNKEIWRVGPYNPNHATNGTMAHRKEYAKTHKYDETVTHAEEKSFLDDYKNEMVQLDPMKTMLVISHARNTFDKRGLRTTNNPFFKKTSLKVNGIIRDKKLRDILIWHDTAPDARAMVTLEDSIAQNAVLPQGVDARPFVQRGDKIEYLDLPPEVQEYVNKQIQERKVAPVQGEMNDGQQTFQCELPPEMQMKLQQHMQQKQMHEQQQQQMQQNNLNDIPPEIRQKLEENIRKATASAQETRVQETPVQETPVQETPVQETPVQETPSFTLKV